MKPVIASSLLTCWYCSVFGILLLCSLSVAHAGLNILKFLVWHIGAWDCPWWGWGPNPTRDPGWLIDSSLSYIRTPLPNQVPQDERSTFSPMGEEDDIPCRRMRSGSYVQAMTDDSCDDSGDSDGSLKLSPKMQARRASYLKATQPSLTEMTTLE